MPEVASDISASAPSCNLQCKKQCWIHLFKFLQIPDLPRFAQRPLSVIWPKTPCAKESGAKGPASPCSLKFCLPAVFSWRGNTKGLHLPLLHHMWFLGQLWEENSIHRFLVPVEEDGEKGGDQDIFCPGADIGCLTTPPS